MAKLLRLKPRVVIMEISVSASALVPFQSASYILLSRCWWISSTEQKIARKPSSRPPSRERASIVHPVFFATMSDL